MWGALGQLQLAQKPGARRLGLVAGSSFTLVIKLGNLVREKKKLGNLSFNTVSPSCLKAQGLNHPHCNLPIILLAFYMLDVSHYVPAI